MKPPSTNPFPGLRPFTQEEDYLFFGREEQTLELLQRLGGNRFVAVVGTSGSGKSSLVRCGLLSELLGGRMLEAGAAWEIAVTHPGGNPLALLTDALLEADLYDREAEHARENLLATLSRSHFGLVEAVKQADLGEGTNFLLVVDQFEEIFRFQEAGQRQQEVANEFVSLLLEAAAQKEVPIYVVLTMRSDFIGECGQFEGLAEMVNRGEFLIPRLTREQYKRIIEGPIKVAGGKIAPRLLQRLLNDLGQQADQLPCLQHALMRTWDIWAGKGDTDALDLDDYQRVGNMSQALSLHADEIYESLANDRQRALCQGIFQALTVEESNSRGIRRPQRLGRLCQILEVPANELRPIIDAYRQSGVTFLMPSPEVELTDQTIIDISHESLMRVWTRLRQWVEEETQAAGIYHRLSESADLHDRGKAGLYRDPELGIALAWRESKRPNAAWAERYRPGFATAMGFLEASRQASVAEEQSREAARQRELEQAQQLAEAQQLRLEHQQRAARKLRKMIGGLAVVALVAGLACVAALVANKRANDLAVVAKQKSDIAEASAAEADRERETALQAQQATQQALTQVESQKAAVESSLSKAEQAERSARVAEKRSREFLYATDMQLAAMLVGDERANARQVMSRLADHVPSPNKTTEDNDDLRGFEWHYLKRLAEGPAAIFTGFDKPVADSVVTPEGELITLEHEGLLKRWDATTRLEKGVPLDLKQGRNIRAFAISRDGRRVAVAIGDKVHLVDAATGAETAPAIPAQTWGDLIFSPGSPMLVTVDTGIGWWDMATGKPIAQKDLKLTAGGPVAISADGLTVAVGGQGSYRDNFSVCRMNPQTREIAVLMDKAGGYGTKRTLAISPDGATVAVSYFFAGQIDLYETSTGKLLLVHPAAHSASISAIGFNPGGKEIVTGSMDGAIKVWADFKQLQSTKITRLMGHAEQVNTIAFAPGGKRVVSVSLDKTVRLWNLEQSASALHRTLAVGSSGRARFSPDGMLMAISGDTGFRDGATGEAVSGMPGRSGELGSDCVAFSPDNRLLAAGFGGKRDVSFVELWDIARGERLAVMPATTDIPGYNTTEYSGLVSGLAFSPDGKHLVAGFGSLHLLGFGNQGNFPLLVYDVPTRRVIRRLEGHRNFCISVTFSSDGAKMASASYDGTAAIWDTATWKKLHVLTNSDAASDRGHQRVQDVAFSPDGSLLAMASAEGNVIIWDAVTGQPLQTLSGHTNEVWSVAFTPDGRTLASGSMDGTIRLWNTATWRELVRLDPGARFNPMSLTFSPDGSRLLAAGLPTLLWSVPANAGESESLAKKLAALVQSNADFQSRLRMLSENLGLQAALEKLDSNDVRVPAALAAAQANWQASRQAWPEAALAFDRLTAADPAAPEAWLRTPGLLRLATALLHQDRPGDAAALLTGGAKRRTADGLPAAVDKVALDLPFTVVGSDAVVGKLPPGSPAAKGGLRQGDIIDKVDDTDLANETLDKFVKLLAGEAGTKVRLTVRRSGSAQPLVIELIRERFVDDAATGELLHPLRSAINERLAQEPRHPGLLELRAELAGRWSDSNAQLADYTAAIEALAEQGATDAAADLQRLYGRRGNTHVALRQWPQAVDDYARSVTDTTTDEAVLANQALAKAEVLIPPGSWTVVKAVKAESKLGATLSILPDDSILASGANTVNDRYRVVLTVDTDIDLAAVRLEALTHDSLPANGPGRYPGRDPGSQYRGTFAQGSCSVTATLPNRKDSITLEFANVAADLGETISKGFWSIAGQGEGRNCSVVWSLPQPVSLTAGTSLTFEMQFGGVGTENLGHFRLSISSDLAIFEREQKRFAANRITDPWQKLAAAYQLQGDRQAIDQLVERRPQLAGKIGDLFIQDQDKD